MYLAQPLARSGDLDLPVERKAQWIRGFHLLVTGPLMLAGGVSMWRQGSKLWGGILGTMGVGFMFVSAFNFVRVAWQTNGAKSVQFRPTRIEPELQETDGLRN